MPDEEQRLGEMRRRVDAFIAKHKESPLYDFDTPSLEAQGRLRELTEGLSAYARGELTEDGVARLARLYCAAYKRPEGRVSRPRPQAPPPRKFASRAMFKEAERRQAEAEAAIWLASLEEHFRNFPDCKSPYCPYCPHRADLTTGV